MSEKTSPPTSVSDLIQRFPSFVIFSQEIGCGYEAARQMRNRDSINPKYWNAIIKAARRYKIPGVTSQWLTDQRDAKEGFQGQ